LSIALESIKGEEKPGEGAHLLQFLEVLL